MDANGSAPAMRGREEGWIPRPLLAAVAVFVLALAASCGGASGGGGQQPAGSGEREAPAEEQALGREALGNADAPVVLTEYGDYQ